MLAVDTYRLRERTMPHSLFSGQGTWGHQIRTLRAPGCGSKFSFFDGATGPGFPSLLGFIASPCGRPLTPGVIH